MLKKLFKYDFKAVMKHWWIVALSSVVLSVVGGWCISVFASEKELPEVAYLVATLLGIVVILGLIAFVFFTVISLCTRFYRNFFTDEGYLTFTLPVKRSELLNSKLLVTILVNIITTVVIVADVIIALCIGVPEVFLDAEFWREIWDEFVIEIIEETGFYSVIYFVEILVSVVLYIAFTGLFTYVCITIASLIAKKAKILTAVAIYYVANSVFTFVIQIFYLFGIESLGEWLYDIPKEYEFIVYGLVLFVVVLLFATLCAVLYALQYWLLDRKLNLS